MSAPYPWLAEPWARFGAAFGAGKLAHAYLLAGAEGLGKRALAEAMTAATLCERQTLPACGTCRGCILLAAGSHPDYRLLAPEEDKRTIVIEQVRDLIAFHTLKSHYAARKAALVCPAEAMTTGAANALLKVLEEPPPGALIVLVSHRPGLLPPTVTSRCQRIACLPPGQQAARAWLADVHPDAAAASEEHVIAGAPLAAAAELESDSAALHDDILAALGAVQARRERPLAVAARFADVAPVRFVDALERLVQALALARAGHAPRALHLPARQRRDLQEISNKLNSKPIFLYLDEIVRARSMVFRSSGVRGAEVIEQLWFAWARTTQTESTA